MNNIDLRSDTITKPSPEMREAIMNAEVGDDVFGEDPTVNKLQDMAASIFNKEAALYVSSGTMANEIAVNLHTNPGEEIIIESNCHIYHYENGAASFLSGVSLALIEGIHGIMTADQVEKAVRHYPLASPVTSMISIENSHNYAGGTVYPIDVIEQISEIALKNGLKRHLDGARLYNACAAEDIQPADYAKFFDSVSFCLSKGLGAPIGSMLLGTQEFINEARRVRRVFGGGMRQAGIIAAAGIYALENNIDRLRIDHNNAKNIAETLDTTDIFSVDISRVRTNIVIAEVIDPDVSAEEAVEMLERIGILVYPFGENRVRFVLHLDVSETEIEDACSRIKKSFN